MSKKRDTVKIKATIFDKRGRILSVGRNQYTKSHPIMAKYGARINQHKIVLHAEVDAILKCIRTNKISNAHRILIERYDKMGNPAPCAPCEICMKIIAEITPIKKIEHT